jgi:hypothetical protein
MTVRAERVVIAPPEAVYEFLADLSNHYLISVRQLDLVALAPGNTGGRIVIRGPLGIRRTARTMVTWDRPTTAFGGTARVGSRTRAAVDWGVRDCGTVTRVTLSAHIMNAGLVDRALLAVGGRRWLGRCFRHTLARLAHVLGPGSPREGAAGEAGAPAGDHEQ